MNAARCAVHKGPWVQARTAGWLSLEVTGGAAWPPPYPLTRSRPRILACVPRPPPGRPRSPRATDPPSHPTGLSPHQGFTQGCRALPGHADAPALAWACTFPAPPPTSSLWRTRCKGCKLSFLLVRFPGCFPVEQTLLGAPYLPPLNTAPPGACVPRAAVTTCHKLGGLKQQKGTVSQFRSQRLSPGRCRRPVLPGKPVGGSFPVSPSSCSLGQSLACGHITAVSASSSPSCSLLLVRTPAILD